MVKTRFQALKEMEGRKQSENLTHNNMEVSDCYKKVQLTIRKLRREILNAQSTLTDPKKGELEFVIENLQHCFRRARDAQDLYEEVALESGVDIGEDTDMSLLHTECGEILGKLRDSLNKLEVSTRNRSSCNSRNEIGKLPTIQLGTFDGDLTTWEDFWATFDAMIHRQESLPPIYKLRYLKSALRGEAADAIKDYNNYHDAVAKLLDRYTSNRAVYRAHARNLINLEHPKHEAKDITRFYNNLDGMLRRIKDTLRLEEDDVVAELIWMKLSNETREWLQHRGQRLHFSLRALNEHLRLLSNILNEQQLTEERKIKGKQITYTKKGTTTSTTNKGETSATDIGTYGFMQSECILCNQGHNTADCNKYVNRNERLCRIRTLQRCTRCMKGNHEVHDCTWQMQCKTCQGPHHHWTCPKKTRDLESVIHTRENSEKSNEAPQLNSHPTSEGTPLNSTALPTAMVRVYNTGTKGRVPSVRAFFDVGSQVSCITPELAKKLVRPKEKLVKVRLRAFGHDPEDYEGSTVQVPIQLGSKRLRIRALVTDRAKIGIQVPGLEAAARHLKEHHVRLADPQVTDEIDDVQLVIGADYFARLVGGTQEVDGIHLLQTPGGSMITGVVKRAKSEHTLLVHEALISHMFVPKGACFERYQHPSTVTTSKPPKASSKPLGSSSRTTGLPRSSSKIQKPPKTSSTLFGLNARLPASSPMPKGHPTPSSRPPGYSSRPTMPPRSSSKIPGSSLRPPTSSSTSIRPPPSSSTSPRSSLKKPGPSSRPKGLPKSLSKQQRTPRSSSELSGCLARPPASSSRQPDYPSRTPKHLKYTDHRTRQKNIQGHPRIFLNTTEVSPRSPRSTQFSTRLPRPPRPTRHPRQKNRKHQLFECKADGGGESTLVFLPW